MAKRNEAEEKSSFNIGNDVLISESPSEKEYAKGPDESAGKEFIAPDIEEPPIGKPGEEKRDLFEAEGEKKEAEKEDLDPKQKRELAKQLSGTFMEGYDKLNQLILNLLKFNEEKYEIQALRGDFDLDALNIRLPLNEDGSQSITIREFGHTINKQLDEVFVVTEEFKENTGALLSKYFEQHGYGMTIGQKLIIVFGEDVIRKSYLAIQIKGTMARVVEIAIDTLEELKRQGKTPTMHADDITIESEEVDDEFMRSHRMQTEETEKEETEKEEAEEVIRPKRGYKGKSKSKPSAKKVTSEKTGKGRGRPKKESIPIADDLKEPEETEKPE